LEVVIAFLTKIGYLNKDIITTQVFPIEHKQFMCAKNSVFIFLVCLLNIESASLAEQWQSEGFRNFLDLGCGLGRHTVYMGTHGLEVTAFDFSDEAVQETRNWEERENLQIEARAGNMLALPYKNDSFDCIIAYNVI
jgi:2-polyprenyl-3-methyl-5-hydroxy-6-metoxy-1,4-benzoquinol methylase